MKYKKKPVVIEATQWFKNGDHPEDYPENFPRVYRGMEGRVVERYLPVVGGDLKCSGCSNFYTEHGWVKTLEGGHIVCPGDWIITGVKGEHYPCKPDVFLMTYDPVEE